MKEKEQVKCDDCGKVIEENEFRFDFGKEVLILDKTVRIVCDDCLPF
jgi:hypothetical protein